MSSFMLRFIFKVIHLLSAIRILHKSKYRLKLDHAESSPDESFVQQKVMPCFRHQQHAKDFTWPFRFELIQYQTSLTRRCLVLRTRTDRRTRTKIIFLKQFTGFPMRPMSPEQFIGVMKRRHNIFGWSF